MKRIHSLIGQCTTSVLTPACTWLCQQRTQGSNASPGRSVMDDMKGPEIATIGSINSSSGGGGNSVLTFERAWSLWNEGNLFSLSVAQMQQFLTAEGVVVDSNSKKATVVRQLEEYLHAKDAVRAATMDSHGKRESGVGGGDDAKDGRSRQTSPLSQQEEYERGKQRDRYGNWAANTTTAPGAAPETLLDLAQSGFYEGATNMAPKAFQLLVEKSSTDLVISRVNTTAFPGFPANMECYTMVSSDPQVALRTRMSKVLQWCILNMRNLQMDGELFVSLGKLILDPRAVHGNDEIVSTYTIQQRLQLQQPYTWVASVPESGIELAESFLREEGFLPVFKTPRLSFDGTIKKANEQLNIELDREGKLEAIHREWTNVQTVFYTFNSGPDLQLLLRSRPPIRQQESELYSSIPIISLSAEDEDVSDVLPAEHGQLIYLSENETRRFERVTASTGLVLTAIEIRRQPLIVLHDHEEDSRVEYAFSVSFPASAATHPMDARTVALEVLDLAQKLSTVISPNYIHEYGLCDDVPATHAAENVKEMEEHKEIRKTIDEIKPLLYLKEEINPFLIE